MKLNEHHREYLQILTKRPYYKETPEFWPKHMIELHAADIIERIGNRIYLTKKGWSLVDNL